MDTFSETAIFDHHLTFIYWGNQLPFSISVGSKQTEVYIFRFPFIANKQKLRISLIPFSVFRIPETWRNRHETWKHGEIKAWRQGYREMDMETKSDGKQKPKRFAFILFPCTFCCLSVCWQRNNRSYPFANGLNGLKQTWPFMTEG